MLAPDHRRNPGQDQWQIAHAQTIDVQLTGPSEVEVTVVAPRSSTGYQFRLMPLGGNEFEFQQIAPRVGGAAMTRNENTFRLSNINSALPITIRTSQGTRNFDLD